MKWEYNVLDVTGANNRQLEELLCDLGQESWELCGIIKNYVLIFKRPISKIEVILDLKGATEFSKKLDFIANQFENMNII